MNFCLCRLIFFFSQANKRLNKQSYTETKTTYYASRQFNLPSRSIVQWNPIQMDYEKETKLNIKKMIFNENGSHLSLQFLQYMLLYEAIANLCVRAVFLALTRWGVVYKAKQLDSPHAYFIPGEIIRCQCKGKHAHKSDNSIQNKLSRWVLRENILFE